METNSSRNGAASLVVALVLLSFSLAQGCRTHVFAQDEQFRILFDGFQLRLVDDLPSNTPIDKLDSTAFRNSYPTERTLVPGRVYSFSKTAKISDQDLGIKILPERLGKIGANVTKAPKSSDDFIDLYIGGALFVIQFDKDGHQGTILNRVHTSSEPGKHWEELLVAYK